MSQLIRHRFRKKIDAIDIIRQGIGSAFSFFVEIIKKIDMYLLSCHNHGKRILKGLFKHNKQ